MKHLRVWTCPALVAFALLACGESESEDTTDAGAGGQPAPGGTPVAGTEPLPGGEPGPGGTEPPPGGSEPPPGGGEPPPELDCGTACFAVAACATQGEPDYCPGTWFVETRDIIGLCNTVCGQTPDFTTRVAAAGADCAASVEVLRDSPDFVALCDEGRPLPPGLPACDTQGARIAECLVEACPGLDEVEPGFASLFALGCAGAVAQGQITPEQAAGINARSPCDQEPVASTIASLRAEGNRFLFLPPLEPVCAPGRLSPPGGCEGLCENAGACAPETSVLADLNICLAACVPLSTEEGLAQVTCADAATDCNAFARCYTGR